jgi:hypothetical protein
MSLIVHGFVKSYSFLRSLRELERTPFTTWGNWEQVDIFDTLLHHSTQKQSKP